MNPQWQDVATVFHSLVVPIFLTDGGIETTLIFHEGLQLPHFAAFDLLRTKNGEDVLRRYFQIFAGIAQKFGAGLILESPTWRGSADWGATPTTWQRLTVRQYICLKKFGTNMKRNGHL